MLFLKFIGEFLFTVYRNLKGIFALVLEKSAIELKQKLKHNTNSDINIICLNRIGQLREMTCSAIDHNMDVIYVQEQRHLQSEDIKFHNAGDGWMSVSATA